MQITTQTLQDLNRQFNWDFQNGFQGRSQLWNRRARQVPSTTFENVYGWLAELPEMRKWVGDRVLQNLVGRSYSLKNDPFELTISVDRRAIEFDQIGQYNERFRLAGESAAMWKDKLITDVQLANPLCFDGQSFYDVDHPVNLDDSTLGIYANDFTVLPLNTDNLWTICANMMAFKGENGVPLEVVPTVLEVPPQLAKKGTEALKAANVLATVKNVAGTENVGGAAVSNVIPGMTNLELVVNPRLASQPLYWYVHSTNRMMPFLVQVAKEPGALVQMTDPTHENVFFRREYIWGTEADGAAGVTLPFLSCRVKETA